MKPAISIKQYAFTLLELMLVILVVALVSVYAVQIINQHLAYVQISRAATQIVGIKQAATTFYINQKKQWPQDIQNLIDANYLPNNASCSPFPGLSSSAQCGYYAQYTFSHTPHTTFSQLSLSLPSIKLAKQLEAATPNAWISTGTSTLNIAITPPADLSWQKNHGWIVSAGVVSTFANGENESNLSITSSNIGTAVYLPDCPPPFEGHVLLFPLNYQTNGAGGSYWNMHITQMKTGSTSSNETDDDGLTSNSSTSIVYKQSQDNYANQGFAASVGDDAGATASAMNHLVTFLTICVPPADNGIRGHWATYGLNANFLQDGQCSSGLTPDSWLEYNPKTLPCSSESAVYSTTSDPISDPNSIVGSPIAD